MKVLSFCPDCAGQLLAGHRAGIVVCSACTKMHEGTLPDPAPAPPTNPNMVAAVPAYGMPPMPQDPHVQGPPHFDDHVPAPLYGMPALPKTERTRAPWYRRWLGLD